MKFKIRTRIIIYFIILVSLIVLLSGFLTLYSLKIETENVLKSELKNKFYEISSIIKYISKDKSINKSELNILDKIFTNDLIQIIENDKIIFSSDKLDNNILNIDKQDIFYKSKIQNEDIIYYSNILNKESTLQIGFFKDNDIDLDFFKKTVLYETIEIIFALILTIIFSLLISKIILIPIEKIIYEIKNTRADNINKKIDISYFSNDEIGELANEFNKLIERVNFLINAQRQFLSNVSHELRTPLTSIIGHSELIKRRGKLNNDLIENSSEIIIKEANRLVKLVNELIYIEKIQSKDFSLEKINLFELINDVYEIFYPICERLYFDSKYKNIQILGNKDYLKRVFINLIDNAIYATKDKGEINIYISIENDFAIIIVKDTGIGINKDKIENIFDRFYKSEIIENENKSGLGLSIVKEIIENHNGKISVKSIIGKETIFEIRIPII